MLADSEIDSSRIKVVTENGIVYLMGLVTRDEADRAADLTRKSSGVQKVVRIFEYIQP
jgi:osmotically-inducible protein OsmY